MFVGAGDEAHVSALRPAEPRHRVGGNRFIGMADVRAAVGIADRGGDVEGLGHGPAPSGPALALQGDRGEDAAELENRGRGVERQARGDGERSGGPCHRHRAPAASPPLQAPTGLAREQAGHQLRGRRHSDRRPPCRPARSPASSGAYCRDRPREGWPGLRSSNGARSSAAMSMARPIEPCAKSTRRAIDASFSLGSVGLAMTSWRHRRAARSRACGSASGLSAAIGPAHG